MKFAITSVVNKIESQFFVLWYGIAVGQFNYASHIWLGYTLVAMATKIFDFQHKIGYRP